MTWLKKNWFKIGILVIGIIVAFAFWQNLVVIPREKEFQKQSQESWKKIELESCLNTADATYRSYWSSQCEVEGKKDDCTSLLTYHAEAAEKLKQQEKDNCFQQYR